MLAATDFWSYLRLQRLGRSCCQWRTQPGHGPRKINKCVEQQENQRETSTKTQPKTGTLTEQLRLLACDLDLPSTLWGQPPRNLSAGSTRAQQTGERCTKEKARYKH